jgi:membrane-associated protease RseP (regulator of RpoE activity)
MLQGVGVALAIIVFVTVHEAGHFLAAKAVGMKVNEFFFGFGPKIWSTRKGETEYGFKWLPLGGYVRIVGMNPLEEVAPEDMGRTYREKRFWEKSFVVLAGVGLNFLMALLLFYAIFMFNGVSDPQPIVAEVVPTVDTEGVEMPSPAAEAGLRPGDEILAIGPMSVEGWLGTIDALAAAGPGPTTLTIARGGNVTTIDIDLTENTLADGTKVGFLGIRPQDPRRQPGAFEGVGLAAGELGTGIRLTFEAIGNLLAPSSIAQYLGVFVGETDVDLEARPVSPIGIVNLGAQTSSWVGLAGTMAILNVTLATFNMIPLPPLDGGHFAVAFYEKVTGRTADVRKLAPIAVAVVGIFAFLGLVAIILDVVDPISLS